MKWDDKALELIGEKAFSCFMEISKLIQIGFVTAAVTLADCKRDCNVTKIMGNIIINQCFQHWPVTILLLPVLNLEKHQMLSLEVLTCLNMTK